MRTSPRRLTLPLAGALLFTACFDPRTPSEPRIPATSAAPAKTLRSDGFIVIMKRGTSLSRMRPGARLGNIIPLNGGAGSQDAVIADALPSIGGVVVRGVQHAEDLTGDDVAAVIPNYLADVIEPAPTNADAVVTADDGSAPTGTDQSSAFFFANFTQWSYRKIQANRVWIPSHGGAGANVCIVDSGIDAGHNSFTGKTITSTSLFANSPAQIDSLGHGSHVAGTISTNGFGAASVAPNANLMTAKIFNGVGGGGSTSNIIAAVQWCADHGADIISMSLGFTGGITIAGNEPFIAAFEAGLDYATNLGVLIVAAAGNDGVTLPVAGKIFLPAEAPGVTSVAATAPTTNLSPFGANPVWQAPGAQFDGIASYSNRGPVPSVDISAPGGDQVLAGWPVQGLIISVCSRQFLQGTTFPCAGGNSFLFEAGTSMATPHVSGVAAIIRSRWPNSPRSPALRNKIESCLYKSVDNIGSTSIFGRGRVNAYKAATNPC